MFLLEHLKPPHLIPQFADRLQVMADRLGCNAQHLLMIMFFESRLNPTFRTGANKRYAMSGLIQIGHFDTLRLGTTGIRLARMSAIEQLDYIEEYLKPQAGKFQSLTDTWLACYFPDGLGRGDNYYFRLPEKYATANKVFHTHSTNRTWVWRLSKDLTNYFLRLGWKSVAATGA